MPRYRRKLSFFLLAGLTLVPSVDGGSRRRVVETVSFASAPSSAPECSSDMEGLVRGLLVGVNDYSSPAIDDLEGTVNDVEILANALESLGAEGDNLRTMTDDEATREGVLAALDDLILAADCNDFVLLHFSTHSHRDARSATFLVPHDGTFLGGTFSEDGPIISAQALSAAILDIRNKGAHAFLSADVVYAAGLSIAERQPPRSAQAAMQSDEVWRWAPSLASHSLERQKARQAALFPGAGEFAAFYASDEDSHAMEMAFENEIFGAFTLALAHGIQSAEAPTLRELAARVASLIQEESGGGTRPVFEASDPDLVFLGVARRGERSAEGSVEFDMPALTRGEYVTTKESFDLRGSVPNPQSLLGLFVGGESVPADEDGSFEAELALEPGENRVQVTAFYRDNTATRGSVSINYQGGLATKLNSGQRWAILIGNQNYEHEDFEDLATPIGDTVALAEVLSRRFGFRLEAQDSDGSPSSLVLHDATREDIMNAITLVRASAAPDDQLIIFYAGHGVLVEELDKAYWLPVDAQPRQEWDWVSATDLTDILRFMEVQHVLVISDSCYSGALARDRGGEEDPERRAYEQLWQQRSRRLLASGAEQPVWDGGGEGHSVFARALLEALESIDKSIFSTSDLFHDFIKQQVGGHSDQSPQFESLRKSGHKGGEMILTPKATAAAGSF